MSLAFVSIALIALSLLMPVTVSWQDMGLLSCKFLQTQRVRSCYTLLWTTKTPDHVTSCKFGKLECSLCPRLQQIRLYIL